jgi:hypothetical protein
MVTQYQWTIVIQLIALLLTACDAFHAKKALFFHQECHRPSSLLLVTGDPVRASTGIRPSLHPTTINTIAEALKLRSTKNPDFPMRRSDTVKPVDVAMAAGKLAALALTKRAKASQHDGMTFDEKEEQTVAGRVVGVVMRLDALESMLVQKTQSIGWIKKYDEWDSFGVLEDENGVEERIRKDPLFALSRAECLLAMFLHTVEKPTLEKVKEEVPDGSTIDFIDSDRLKVLFGETI